MANILAIGIATIDLIHVVDRYPNVDSELRAQQQYLWRGGNATNTLTVLSQLGHNCSWLGTLADDSFAKFICNDLDKNKINYSMCTTVSNSVTPTSHILLSDETSSRNIVHYRSLRELISDDYKSINFLKWDWIHFEGRNISETLKLMGHIKQQCPSIKVSLEIEKPRQGIEQLFEHADHIFFSRHYVNEKGYHSAEKFLRDVQPKLQVEQGAVCAWGDQGAKLLTNNGDYFEVPALDINVIDSRAAGDVFNAAYINSCLKGLPILKCVEQACRLAENKCSQLGIDNVTFEV